MAMRKDQIPDNKFTLPLDARELALYTRQITKNAKVFDLEIDASLPGQLRATADRQRYRLGAQAGQAHDGARIPAARR